MPAAVSLAFAIPGGLSRVDEVVLHLGSLPNLSLQAAEHGEGSVKVPLGFSLGSHDLSGSLRAYQEDGWISVAVEVDATQYEAAASQLGCIFVRDVLVALGVDLGRALALCYVLLDEEIEAECPPDAWSAAAMPGITLLPATAPELAAARARSDVLAVQDIGDWVVLFRRLDPLPHVEAAYRS